MAIDIDDPMYQVKLLGVMVRNSEFLREQYQNIRPEWFEDPQVGNLVRAVQYYFEQYNTAPDFTDLRVSARQFAKDDEEKEAYDKLVGFVEESSKHDSTFVADHFKKFTSLKRHKQAIVNYANAIQNKNFDLIPDILNTALREDNKDYLPVDYFGGIYQRVSTPVVRHTISTGMPELDDALDGGHARGELTVVLAFTNVGKSMMLINLVTHAIKMGLKCVHLYTEQKRDTVLRRFDMCLTGKTQAELIQRPKQHAFYIQQCSEGGGELRVADCYKWTVQEIRNFIYRLEFTPDIVSVDYADRLTPSSHYKDYRHELSNIFNDLAALGKEFDVSLLTASQTNREADKKKHVELSHIGEDIGKAQIADTVIALCRTDDERKAQELRIKVLKAREMEGGGEVPCRQFGDRQRIVTTGQWLTNRRNP